MIPERLILTHEIWTHFRSFSHDVISTSRKCAVFNYCSYQFAFVVGIAFMIVPDLFFLNNSNKYASMSAYVHSFSSKTFFTENIHCVWNLKIIGSFPTRLEQVLWPAKSWLNPRWQREKKRESVASVSPDGGLKRAHTRALHFYWLLSCRFPPHWMRMLL